MPEEKEKEEQKKETSKEEQMKSVAEIYGITLSDIEEVHLPNGKEYFKFYNPEDKNLKMIENRDMDRNISEQFKDIQKTLQASQGEDGLANARAVFDYQMQYQNVELTLIPIRELNNNRSSYRYLLDEIDENQRKAIRVLLQNIDYLDLEYINIANAIAVDKQNRVIHSWYNVATGKCELKAAEVRNYENEQKGVDSNGYTVDIPDEEFDHLVEDVDVASDTPTIQEAEEIKGVQGGYTRTIRGRNINMHFAFQAYQYPEILDRSELSDEDRMVYRGVIRAIERRRARQRGRTAERQYVYTRPNNPTSQNSQAAYIDIIWLVLMAGVLSGFAFMFLLFTIQGIL